MAVEFDLLGDPVPENKGKPGANGHVATAANAKKIRLLLVSGFTFEGIAKEMGISVPTLRKHYFQNGRVKYREARARAIAQERGRNLLLLDAEAEKGNVSALKEMRKVVNEASIDLMDQAAQNPGRGKARERVADVAPKAEGKKASNRAAALDAEDKLAGLWSGKGMH